MLKIAARIALLVLVVTALPAATGYHEVLAVPVTVSDDVEVPLPDATIQAAEASVRTDPVATPITFSMVGFELPEGVDELRVRTSADGQDWSDWVDTERVETDDGPDEDTAEAANDRSDRFAEPVWVEEANHLQVELPTSPDEGAGQLRAELIDSLGQAGQGVERKVVPSGGPEAEASNRPKIISRAGWGADESWRRGSPSYARNGVRMGVIHHTASSNTYSDARAVMRSMYHYHTQSLRWNDLGYNIVVDRAGNIYEGRAGGLESGVVGAHASGYNTGSFGVSVMGNYEHAAPPAAALTALRQVLAWQSAVYDIDPQGSTTMNGAWTRTIVGHRQVGNTVCPGRIMNHLESLRSGAASDRGRYQASTPDTSPPDAPDTRFPDVAGTHRPAVLELAEAKVINGCSDNRFCPDRGLTRAQMASLMARALNLSASGSGQRFSDVASNHPHRAGIHALVEAGVVSGYRDGSYRPQEHVSRDQMATFLANGLGLRRQAYQGRFTDVPVLSTHAQAVEAVARSEITLGCDSRGTRYCPRDTLRRDQAASLLHRGLRR